VPDSLKRNSIPLNESVAGRGGRALPLEIVFFKFVYARKKKFTPPAAPESLYFHFTGEKTLFFLCNLGMKYAVYLGRHL
jgi:hypothetical protein